MYIEIELKPQKPSMSRLQAFQQIQEQDNMKGMNSRKSNIN